MFGGIASTIHPELHCNFTQSGKWAYVPLKCTSLAR